MTSDVYVSTQEQVFKCCVVAGTYRVKVHSLPPSLPPSASTKTGSPLVSSQCDHQAPFLLLCHNDTATCVKSQQKLKRLRGTAHANGIITGTVIWEHNCPWNSEEENGAYVLDSVCVCASVRSPVGQILQLLLLSSPPLAGVRNKEASVVAERPEERVSTADHTQPVSQSTLGSDESCQISRFCFDTELRTVWPKNRVTPPGPVCCSFDWYLRLGSRKAVCLCRGRLQGWQTGFSVFSLFNK